MPVFSGVASSYDLPQYIGELFQKSEQPNAFLRAIGGLTGAIRNVGSREFTMGVDYILPAPVITGKLEGAAPVNTEQLVGQTTNVVQIFQEGVSMTYSAQGDTGSLSGLSIIPGSQGAGAVPVNPRSIEWQREKAMERVARNVNKAFLTAVYTNPANNATARVTRGLRSAITTNVFTNGAVARPMTKALFESSLRSAMVASSFVQGAQLFAFADAVQYANLVSVYEPSTAPPRDREVAGLNVKTIVTPWASVHLVWEPDMTAGEILLAQPQFCRVVAMPIPGKGILFSEPLAKTGSADAEQIYGELGLDYRNEIFHARIGDLALT